MYCMCIFMVWGLLCIIRSGNIQYSRAVCILKGNVFERVVCKIFMKSFCTPSPSGVPKISPGSSLLLTSQGVSYVLSTNTVETAKSGLGFAGIFLLEFAVYRFLQCFFNDSVSNNWFLICRNLQFTGFCSAGIWSFHCIIIPRLWAQNHWFYQI